MARRRLQLHGNLYQQGGFWKLRWREDQINEDGETGRGWSKPVWIGPSEGAGKLTEKQAQRISWENFLSRLDQNNRVPQSVMTVAQFIERKFRPEHVDQLKRSGQLHYDYILKLVAPLNDLRLRDVTVDDVQRLCAALLKQHYSVQTVRHARNCVSAIFNHAISREWFTGVNPASRVKLPQMTRKEPHALTIDQLRELVTALPSPAKEMVQFAVATSMNVAEICGLQWKRVNLTQDWITVDGQALAPMSLAVRRQWYRGQASTLKTGARRRDIAIAGPLAVILAGLKQRDRWTGPDDTVFASANGTPLDEHNIAKRHLKRVGKEIGMPWLSWHAFRRTALTMADQLGMGTADRKAFGGHSTDAMAAHYVVTDRERQREVLERIAEQVTGRVM